MRYTGNVCFPVGFEMVSGKNICIIGKLIDLGAFSDQVYSSFYALLLVSICYWQGKFFLRFCNETQCTHNADVTTFCILKGRKRKGVLDITSKLQVAFFDFKGNKQTNKQNCVSCYKSMKWSPPLVNYAKKNMTAVNQSIQGIKWLVDHYTKHWTMRKCPLKCSVPTCQ